MVSFQSVKLRSPGVRGKPSSEARSLCPSQRTCLHRPPHRIFKISLISLAFLFCVPLLGSLLRSLSSTFLVSMALLPRTLPPLRTSSNHTPALDHFRAGPAPCLSGLVLPFDATPHLSAPSLHLGWSIPLHPPEHLF